MSSLWLAAWVMVVWAIAFVMVANAFRSNTAAATLSTVGMLLAMLMMTVFLLTKAGL